MIKIVYFSSIREHLALADESNMSQSGDKEMQVKNVTLREKVGGKSGHWQAGQ